MCKARDVAVVMINKSISLSKEKNDESYYMDFIKLHKLLYLANCCILAKYSMKLFEDKVSAYRCGPYVDGIGFVPVIRGFGLIKEEIEGKYNQIPFLPISYSRSEVVDFILERYGRLTTDEIVELAKNTKAYREFEGQYEQHRTIMDNQMAESGKELLNSQ